MRERINVLWLEDELNSMSHKVRKKVVKDILEEKGYNPNISEFRDFSSAYKELKTNERYDFFISDYNLNDSETGLTYLEKIREEKGYKQFVILYSNNEYSEIKKDVIDILKNRDIDVFSNFTFFSIADKNDKNNFKNAIDVILCRWDELNAIRGRYMCDNAEIEYLLRCKLCEYDYTSKTYKQLIHKFWREKVHFANKNKNQKLYDSWLELVDKKNMLAHVEELYCSEKGYYIESKDTIGNKKVTIYENELDRERKELKKLKDKLKAFIDSPN